ncbi:MAG: PIN domain-containing protein [Ruminococcaceae bacterium]|nr:PIN domain-containing protein [Oscillospiraceae bacterium]
MKVMIDTNVIIDVLLERENFVEESYKVLSMCEGRHISGFVSASSVTDIYYLVRKYTHSAKLAYKAIGKLLEIVKVCDVTNNDVLTAFQKKAKDFEDCLVSVCARSNSCKYIITRNKKDFENFEVEALTPTEFLNTSI